MNSVSKVKVIVGYALLLAVMIFSLFFVNREMENLMLSDNRDVQWTDSLLVLLRQKDTNTIRMLHTLSQVSDSMVSTGDIEHIIAQQDSEVAQQRVKHRVITHRDTVLTRPKKKGFFRRLGEVFVPPKKDTAIQVKTSLEFATDTVIEAYNPADSLHEKLRAVAKKRKSVNTYVQRRKRNLQHLDEMLTARIDTLLQDYEEETLEQVKAETEYQQKVRQRSAGIIGGIAIGAVLLAALFLIIIGRDITRSNRYRKELEEARRRAEDLLATREKLMLAITHDFKAPLGSIIGYADLLSRLTVDERQRFYLDNMRTSSEHLLKLVVDLLDFHRLDLHKAEINRVTFHPSKLLEEICVSFKPLTAEKGLTLNCEIAPELHSTFISDPLRLRQIINNLLSNAVKFTESGSITLTAGYENRKLVVAITDTGKGMPSADCERIFQEFTRLPGAQGKEGFGLGLSIVRMLVQLLEGTIKVDSTLDKGSTFTLSVPIYPVETNPDKQPVENEALSLPAVSLRKVLLIDDDRIQLTLTSAMLSQSGITSVSCLQVDELLEALRTDTFDVLLSDVQMPAVSGFDLLKLLRASNIPQARTIPVVAVTARSDMKREEFIAHHFSGCLYKPFTIQEFLQEMCLIRGESVTEGEDSAASLTQEVMEGSVSAPHSGYNFAALTAFSDNDPDAAKSIKESFVSETRINADRLKQAVNVSDMDEVAAVAHKMIPLFTLLGAAELVSLLKHLEAAKGEIFSEELKQKAFESLGLIEDVLTQATLN